MFMNTINYDYSKPSLTKIIITVSPILNEVHIYESFINQGITIFRINFSHGSTEEHKNLIQNLRQASKNTNKIITICLDTKGQEFRINLTKSSELNVKTDDVLTFSSRKHSDTIFIPINDFSVLKTGMKFYLDDGLLALEVVELGVDHIKGKALNCHRIKNNKKVNFPGIEFATQGLNKEDQKDILFGMKEGVDVIFASFILQKNNVLRIKEIVKDIPVFSKIEAIKSVDNIDEIIDASDGIMVARGDLGVETGFVEMFEVQKSVSMKCLEKCKPVICATQMLESMTDSTIPLRSEISDIGNAVLDEYDALMLSGETAVGKNPFLCTNYMQNIIKNAEKFVERTKKKTKCPFIGQGNNTCIITEIDDIKMFKSLYNLQLGIIIFVMSEDIKFLSVVNLYRGVVPVIKSTKSVNSLADEYRNEYGYTKILHFVFDTEKGHLKTINIL